MTRFCTRCGKITRIKGEACQICGLKHGLNGEGGHFLSGPFASGGPMISLAPGDMFIDRFRIKYHLGNGRFGAVYLAEDELDYWIPFG